MTERIRPCLCALDDAALRERLAQIMHARRLTTVVETGIDWGGSTRWFAQMAARVFGVDSDEARIRAFTLEMHEDGLSNITLIHGNSPDVLRDLAAQRYVDFDAARTLFFLDAHWYAYWPLRDEIRAIPRGQGVIVMHDAVVPGCPGLGFDVYDGHALSYDYVKDVLTEWSPGHRVDYNDDSAQGSRRGVLFAYPEPA